MTENNGNSYKLSSVLMGHSMDVRGVASGQLPDGSLFISSVSRDKTCRIWTPSGDGSYQISQTNEGHTKYVSCVFVLPPTTIYPKGLILTGGHDHSILAYELGNVTALFRLSGHRGNVCSLDYHPDGLLISGSWDMTAKVWRGQENIETLNGHQAAVWSVASVPGPIRRILTGSADRQIRLWIDSTTVKTYTGHTDCVRSLIVLDHTQFLSSANDASIRLWNIETGETLNTFFGHTNYIYGMAKFQSSNDFVTVGEDRTLRIWRNSDCKQVIHLPALSVWAVATMKNGDIITGSSDGIVRVFTSDPARVASDDVIAAFEQDVASSKIAAQQELGGMKISELPGPEVLLREGKKDGDTIMVREGALVTCYSWSASNRKWSKIGDVVGASGATQNTSGRQLHEGVEYDYVFTIELDDKTTLKLPYNITEDPWFAAQKFIDKHSLPASHLDQVANFITKNTQGMQLNMTSNSSYFDPFTGGNRYVPGSAGGPELQPANGGGGVDPFTGSGAYTTGSSRSSSTSMPAASSNLSTSSVAEFPVQKFLRFPQEPKYQALSAKLEEFIEKMNINGQTGGIKTTDVNSLIEIGKSSQWTSEKETLLQLCLTKWPTEYLFPIFDLIRIGVMIPAIATDVNKAFPICEDLAEKFMNDSGINQMLILRALCNIFGTLDEALIKNQTKIISTILNNSSKDKRNQVGAASVFLNYTIALTISSEYATNHKNESKSSRNRELYTEILMALITLIDVVEDPEAIYRILVGIGNMISKDTGMKQLFVSLGGDSLAKNYKANGPVNKIQNCADQILNQINNST